MAIMLNFGARFSLRWRWEDRIPSNFRMLNFEGSSSKSDLDNCSKTAFQACCRNSRLRLDKAFAGIILYSRLRFEIFMIGF